MCLQYGLGRGSDDEQRSDEIINQNALSVREEGAEFHQCSARAG
jgi:hypothetical protein